MVEQARLALAITPMIDVVFLLLVYFLLTSGFGSAERLLRTEPAPAEARAPADSLALEEEPIVVRVARGSVFDVAVDMRRYALLTPETPRGLFGPEHPVRIAPAADLAWQDVVAVFDAVRAAGYRMVAFGGGA